MTKRKKIIIIVSIIVAIAIIVAIILCLAFCKKQEETHTAEKVTAISATCDKNGNIEFYYCSDCGKYFSDADCTIEITLADTVISAKGHTEVTDAAVAATCTETGLTEGKHCSDCNTVITAQEEVPALGHNWGEGVTTKEATCTEAGETTYTCTRCNATKTEEIATTGHNLLYGAPHEPTCTEIGNYEFWICSKCGALFTDIDMVDQVRSVVRAATGHSWDDGVVTTAPTATTTGVTTYTCTKCGATKTEEIAATGYSEGLLFECVTAADGVDGYAILINIGTCTDTAIVIPDTYEGLAVQEIEGEAFSGKDIVSVVIPESVTYIGSSAFAGCEKLESVTIGSKVTYIGSGAFEDCTSLTSVTFKTTEGWTAGDTKLASSDLANSATAAKYLTDTYLDYDWEIS